MAAKGPPVTLRSSLEAIAQMPLNERTCGDAEATLAADAWALGAFRIAAFCRAAGGALAEADGLLARLEAFAPDPGIARARAAIAEHGGALGRPAQLAAPSPRR